MALDGAFTEGTPVALYTADGKVEYFRGKVVGRGDRREIQPTEGALRGTFQVTGPLNQFEQVVLKPEELFAPGAADEAPFPPAKWTGLPVGRYRLSAQVRLPGLGAPFVLNDNAPVTVGPRGATGDLNALLAQLPALLPLALGELDHPVAFVVRQQSVPGGDAGPPASPPNVAITLEKDNLVTDGAARKLRDLRAPAAAIALLEAYRPPPVVSDGGRLLCRGAARGDLQGDRDPARRAYRLRRHQCPQDAVDWRGRGHQGDHPAGEGGTDEGNTKVPGEVVHMCEAVFVPTVAELPRANRPARVSQGRALVRATASALSVSARECNMLRARAVAGRSVVYACRRIMLTSHPRAIWAITLVAALWCATGAYSQEAKSAPGRGFALILGVGDFRASELPPEMQSVPACVSDAVAVARLLAQQDYYRGPHQTHYSGHSREGPGRDDRWRGLVARPAQRRNDRPRFPSGTHRRGPCGRHSALLRDYPRHGARRCLAPVAAGLQGGEPAQLPGV